MDKRDRLYSLMPVRRDFPQNRILDGKHSVDQLVTAVQDYWFGKYGGESDPASVRDRSDEILDRFADWFWHNGVVEITSGHPEGITIAPKYARKYAEDAGSLTYMLGHAIERYQDRDMVKRLFTTAELRKHLKSYWFEKYGTVA